MSYLYGTNTECLYSSIKAGTAKNTFTTEAQINDIAGMGVQANIPANFWAPNNTQTGKGIWIRAVGILSTTATPTFTWSVRLGAAGNISTTPQVLASAALTTASGVSNKQWVFEGMFVLESIGATGGNSTVRGAGQVVSPGGLASPFAGEVWGAATQPGTVATVDTSITNYVNFNAACGTSNASNSIQLLQLIVFGLN